MLMAIKTVAPQGLLPVCLAALGVKIVLGENMRLGTVKLTVRHARQDFILQTRVLPFVQNAKTERLPRSGTVDAHHVIRVNI